VVKWCPYSHLVRLRPTELGLDVVLRQVPAGPDERDGMERAVGVRGIPTLVAEDGTVLAGCDVILARFAGLDGGGGATHREKMRDEWSHWLELEGDRQRCA
jgi:glutathione S-transferase